jgi:hypothetical protein
MHTYTYIVYVHVDACAWILEHTFSAHDTWVTRVRASCAQAKLHSGIRKHNGTCICLCADHYSYVPSCKATAHVSEYVRAATNVFVLQQKKWLCCNKTCLCCSSIWHCFNKFVSCEAAQPCFLRTKKLTGGVVG